MLFLEVPPFDMLTGQDVPYPGFGETEVFDSALPPYYVQAIDLAVRRVHEVFSIDIGDGTTVLAEIENVINKMWEEGWSPRDHDINLFTTDFGCVITQALRETLAGEFVLRSETDLSHASVWWREKAIEVFPFHVTYKRLMFSDGLSLVYFEQRLHSLILSC